MKTSLEAQQAASSENYIHLMTQSQHYKREKHAARCAYDNRYGFFWSTIKSDGHICLKTICNLLKSASCLWRWRTSSSVFYGIIWISSKRQSLDYQQISHLSHRHNRLWGKMTLNKTLVYVYHVYVTYFCDFSEAQSLTRRQKQGWGDEKKE